MGSEIILKPVRASELQIEKCPVGCSLLDTFLRGGVPCGETGTCKTQLSLQALLSAVKSESEGGMGAKAIYIYTEGEPPIKRLREMAVLHESRELLNHIYVKQRVYDPQQLFNVLKETGPFIASQSGRRIKLLVIDSIANVFRNIDTKDFTEKASELFKLATLLKCYATSYNIAVLVTNQVADVLDDASQVITSVLTANMCLQSSGRLVVPALGLSWANCVNTRLFLSRVEPARFDKQSYTRCMQIVFSPYLPESYCYYTVQTDGVKGVETLNLQRV